MKLTEKIKLRLEAHGTAGILSDEDRNSVSAIVKQVSNELLGRNKIIDDAIISDAVKRYAKTPEIASSALSKLQVINKLSESINEGVIEKDGDKWRIRSAKTGKLWPAHYDTEEKAKAGLRAYQVHAHGG